MEKFRFRFERLLEVKGALEERLRSEVARRERLLAAARSDVAALRRSLAEREEQIRALSDGPFPVYRAVHLQQYAAHLRTRISEGMDAVVARERELADAKTELLTMAKERKTLERLRERDLRAHREELARKEQKAMDEMAQQAGLRGAWLGE